MLLNVLEFVSIMLSSIVMAMFLGPWAALTCSIDRLEPVAFVPVLHQLSRNMAHVMTPLMPLSLLVLVPLAVLTFGQGVTFYAVLAVFVLFLIALIVTLRIEVPLVWQMEKWNLDAMPPNWQSVRDRWMSFHIVRISCGMIGLAILVGVFVVR